MSDRKEDRTAFDTLDNQPAAQKHFRRDVDESRAKEKGPTTFSKDVKQGYQPTNEKDDEGNGESDHEIHILTERERRKKMRTMFSDLHALLPQLPPKADKSSIVDEAVRYIRNLQEELEKLQRLKEERVSSHGSADFAPVPSIVPFNQVTSKNKNPITGSHGANHDGINACLVSLDLDLPPSFSTWTSPSVMLNVTGNFAQMSICAIPMPGFFSTVCYVLEKHGIHVVSAHVCSDSSLSHYMIQSQVMSGGTDGDDHQHHHHQRLKAEETYKQAANEIILWISSI